MVLVAAVNNVMRENHWFIGSFSPSCSESRLPAHGLSESRLPAHGLSESRLPAHGLSESRFIGDVSGLPRSYRGIYRGGATCL